MALYTNAATLDEDTAAYTTTGEVLSFRYTAGGVTLTVEKGISNNTAYISFEDATVSASFTARGALIYKSGAVAIQPFVCWTLVQIKRLQPPLLLRSQPHQALMHS
jgi:beta-glucanase (GH16 family)